MASRFVRQFIILLLGFILMMVAAACEEDPTEDPPTISAAQRVTTTLQPPLPLATQTAIFTATLTPSVSPTPSDTPTPSATYTDAPATPTTAPTATPTLAALISEEGAATKRVRQGPDAFDFEQVTSLDAGTAIGVLGFLVNDRSETWYLISFADEEGNFLTGWVRSDLVAIDDSNAVPEITFEEATAEPAEPTAGPTLTPTLTPPPFQTNAPLQTSSPVPTGATAAPESVSNVNVQVGPNERPNNCDISRTPIRTNDTISIAWSWFVYEEAYMQEHLDAVNYQILLDGELLTNWDRYRGEMFPDPQESNYPTVYWYVPVGSLAAGQHTLEYRATWSEAISDGRVQFGPGTENEIETGSCTFVVVAVN